MKAVYYCRVSTDETSQVDALENQIEEAKSCIVKNGWTEVDSYVDEGRSGTQTKKRDEYNRLINDMETDKFDLVVIKSQDRLNRNTKDWYLFIDKLVTNHKKLYFYLDNKFYTPDDALITGIKAILAEDYSRELSKKLNNAHRGRQAKGTSVVITSNTWGYDKVNKEVMVNEKEAEIVRLIFDLYIQGYGSRTISKQLSNMGIKSRTGKDFAEITIRRIIRNPLFMGTAVMNKRHIDFNTKATLNNPKDEWIYHDNIVPAIVTKDMWEKANKIMDTKSAEVHSDEFSTKRIGKNIGKFDLSSKIICGECGNVYWRRYRKNSKGDQIVDWSCSEYVKRGRNKIKDTRGKNLLRVKTENSGCDNIHVNEMDLNNILLNVARDVFNKDNNTIDKLINILKTVFESDNATEEKTKIDTEKNKIINQKNLLLDKLLEDIITNDDYKRKDLELENKLNSLIEQERLISDRVKQHSDLEKRIIDITNYLKEDCTDETNLKKISEHTSKIIIHRDHLEIYLDFYDMIVVDIDKRSKKNKLKKYLYVNSAKYMIPHTDKYRYDGKLKEFNVKLCM